MSDQTSNWFKDYFLRLRPCHEESIKSLLRLVKSSCGGKYGFFSAHASNTFALSIFLINLFSKEIINNEIMRLKSKKIFKNPIVTEIQKFNVFYLAEDYHQDF